MSRLGLVHARLQAVARAEAAGQPDAGVVPGVPDHYLQA